MGYIFPKELKIVTEQGENARFAADFLKDEIFFRSGAVIPVENAADADREAEAGEGENGKVAAGKRDQGTSGEDQPSLYV